MHRLVEIILTCAHIFEMVRYSLSGICIGGVFFRRRQKEKLIISGPFPADPNRLEGDKWRYVILTQLDTEPPPERPPRSRRRRPLHQLHSKQDTVSGCGHWGSVRRRSLGRGSGRRRPPRLGRRDTDVHDKPAQDADQGKSVVPVRTVSIATVKYTRRNGFFDSVDGVMAIVDNMF